MLGTIESIEVRGARARKVAVEFVSGWSDEINVDLTAVIKQRKDNL